MIQPGFSANTTPQAILDILNTYIFPQNESLHPLFKQMIEDFQKEFDELVEDIRLSWSMGAESYSKEMDDIRIKATQACQLYRMAYLASLCSSHIRKKTEQELDDVYHFDPLIKDLMELGESLIENRDISDPICHPAIFLINLVKMLNEIKLRLIGNDAENSFFIDPNFLKAIIKELLHFILSKLEVMGEIIAVNRMLEKITVNVSASLKKTGQETINLLFGNNDVKLAEKSDENKINELGGFRRGKKLAPRPLSLNIGDSCSRELLSVLSVPRQARTPPPPASLYSPRALKSIV